jgi:PAS domain S-box-containing protein
MSQAIKTKINEKRVKKIKTGGNEIKVLTPLSKKKGPGTVKEIKGRGHPARKDIEARLGKPRAKLAVKKKSADEAGEFAENLINTVREPLIALDQDLRVVKANRSFYAFFKVKPKETVGQFFYDLGHKQWDIPKLRELLETILLQKATIDNYEVEHEFPAIGRRVMLLNARQIHRGAGKERIILLAIEDITERKQAEEALRQSEACFRRLAENARDVIYRMSLPDGKYEYVSPAALSIFGCSPDEFYKTPKLIKQVIHPDWQKYFEEQWANLIKGEMPPTFEYQFIHKSGEIRWLNQRNILVRDNAGNPIAIEGIVTDITGRKRAEVVLRINEGRYRVAEAIGHVGNWEYNLQTTKFWGSDEAKRIYGFDPEALDFSTDEVENCIPERERVHQALVDLIEAGKPYNLEFEIHPKNSLKPRIISSIAELKQDEHGNPLLVTGVIQDITERKRAEEELQFRNVLLTTQQEVSIDGILVVDENARILSYNRRFVEMMGLPPKLVEDRADEPVLQFVTAQMADPRSFLQRVQYLYEHRQETSRDELILADGRFFDRYSAPLIGSDKRYFGRVWFFRDITERKRAEMEITRVNRALQMLSDTNQALIHITDEAALLNEVCRITVDVGGYRMTWVGFVEHDEEKTLRPVAHAGFESGYIESAKVSWGDNERGRGPGGTAIRMGRPCIARNIPLDPAFAPWREAAIQRGYKSIIALPLISEGRTLGALGIYSSETDAFDVKEVAILKELANDLAFGVTALRTREKRDQAEVALKKSEARLNEAQRMAHIGSWELDIVNNVLIWSDEIYRMFEIDPKTFGASYEAFLNAIHPDDREAVNLAYTNSLKTRVSYSIDHRLLFPDGRIKYVHERCETYYDADDKPLHSLGTVQDITERKHAEESLLRSEEENRAIINAVPDILFKIDRMGTILDYHSQTESKLYVQPEAFIGKKIEEVLPTHVSMPAKEAIIRTLESASRSKFEYELDMPNGRQSFECRIVPLTGEQVLAIVRDITERKRTEEALEKRLVALTRPLDESAGIEFEELFNLNDIQRLQDEFAKATGVASIITHPDGTPITEPSNFCRLCKDIIRKTDKGRANCFKSDSVLGHFSDQGPSIQPCMSGGLWDAGAGISVGGHHIANWLIGQVRDETQSEDKMRKYAKEIGAEESDFVEAFHEVTAMSQEQFQRVAQALFTLANQLSAIAYQNIQQARFITEHKRAEGKIRNSLVEKEVLLKEVYHRVKNNLMIIIGLIKMQKTKTGNKMFNHLLQELEGRIRSMALVHEGLYQSVDLAHVDLQNYIETMGAQISAQFGADRNIRFSVKAVGVELGLDVAVPCGLILNELITNAYKHAFPGDKPRAGEDNWEIKVIVEQEGDVLTLTVSNNGVVLAADLEKSETLGLRLVQMLSHQINGSIELDRSAGTAFRLKFPVSEKIH